MKNITRITLIALGFLFYNLTAKAQTQPTVNACCVNLVTPTTSSLYFTWTRGNGDYCLVVMRQTSNTIVYPVDGNTYTGSTVFGSGSNLGNSNYVVYKGTGTGITVTNLAVGTYYEIMIYEFNSLQFPYSPNYTSSYGFLYCYTLATQPTSGPTGLMSYNIGPNGVDMSWTPGNGSYSVLGVRQSTSYSGTPVDGTEYYSNTCFGSGGSIGTSSPYAYDVYDGTLSTVSVGCLNPATDYSSGVFTYNGTSGANNYLTTGSYRFFTTLAAEPTASSNWLYVNDVSENAFTVNWLKPSGSGSYSLVTVKQGTSNSNLPADMSIYTANSVYGSGSQVGTGAYVVYNSYGNTVRVTGLTPGTQYTVSIFEFNGGTGTFNNTTNYLTTSYATQPTQTVDPLPTVNSSSLTLTPSTNSVTASWTNGNGGKRIALVKPTRLRTALAFDGTNDYVSVPFNATLQPTTYLTVEAWVYKSDWANNVGWQTVAGNHEGNGGYQIFSYYNYFYGYAYRNGSNGAVYQDVSYLTPGWHHFAMVFDGRYTYLYVDGARKTQADAGTTCSLSYQYSNSFLIGADVGTSTLPQASPNYYNGYVDEVRVWNTARSFSEIRSYMYQSMVGNETGLVGEWSLDDGYATSGIAKNNSIEYTALNGTLNNMTTTAASSFSGTSGWILSGSGVNEPVDNNAYTSNSTFMSGSQVGLQYYTVYNNTGNSVTVTGLTPGTYYNFALFEFNTTAYNNFRTEDYLTQDFQTIGAPLPTITSFTPVNGNLGTVVTINGTNFDGTTPSNNQVYFGTERATVVSATSTQIQAIVPYCTNNVPISVTVNTVSAYSNKPFVVTSSCSGNITNTSFTTGSITSGLSREGVAVGDIDIDGKTDILSVDNSYGWLSFARNTSSNGALSFAPMTSYGGITSPTEVEGGDLDGDYKLDPVIVSTGNSMMTVYRNTSSTSSFSLGSRIDLPTLPNPTNVSIADIDKDGRPDVIVSYSIGTQFSIFRNTSSVAYISFATRQDFSGVNCPYSVQAGDIDGDGKPDIVAGNNNAASYVVFRNTSTSGNISFAAGVTVATSANVMHLTLADMDNDGDNDIIAGLTSGNVVVFKNNCTIGNITSGLLPLQNTLSGFTSNATTEVYDLDGDSRNDIVIGYFASSTVSVYEQTGTFVFASRVDLTGSSSGSAWLGVADFSMDGKSDIVAGTGGTTVTTLNNVMNALVPEPTTPASAITFSSVGQTQVTVNFTAGSGANRLIVAHKGSAVSSFPFDGVGYTPNTVFGSGTDLGGGNYVVYNSNGNSVTVTGLQSYTAYYFAIFEYDGSTCTANYLTSPYVSNNVTTLNTPPTISARSEEHTSE